MDNLWQILADAADGVFVIDENQHIVFWNQAAQEIVGHTSDEVVGRPCYEILSGRDEQSRPICYDHCHVVVAAFTGEGVTNYDTCIRTKAGDARWINVSIFTVPPSNDEAKLMVVHLFRDATQKKQNEEFIRQVLGAAKQLRDESRSQNTLPASVEGRMKELTDREREVLSLLAQGLSTREIAQTLSISLATARNHIQNILHKLQVHSRLEAVAYAFEHELVTKE